MFSIGDKVKIAIDNDNENYDSFRDKILIIESVATNKDEHCYYDESMNGMPLYEFKDKDGNDIPFALYEYEIEGV
jgi:hypothetical protein